MTKDISAGVLNNSNRTDTCVGWMKKYQFPSLLHLEKAPL